MAIRGVIPEFVRYGVTGGAGLVLNIGILVVLVNLVGVSRALAAVVSAGCTLTVTFIGTQRWVFGDQRSGGRRTTLKRAPFYYAVMAAGKGVNFVIYVVLISLGVWYPLAWVIGSGVVFTGTFFANRYVWEKTDISLVD